MREVVVVQVGQCGNQLGRCLLDMCWREGTAAAGAEAEEGVEEGVFFRRSGCGGHGGDASEAAFARAVLVDCEPRVVRTLQTEEDAAEGWRYRARNVVHEHAGAGNNWGMGYHAGGGGGGTEGSGTGIVEAVLDRVRAELEACDMSAGCLLLHSMAGGTGSGLGSRLTEEIKCRFEEECVMNVAVAPYTSGEVVVQSYNTLLTLSSLIRASDGAILLQNAVYDQLCREMLGIPHGSLDDLNTAMTEQLAAFLLPKTETSVSAADAEANVATRHCSLLTDLTHLCPHPSYKFLDIKFLPQMPRSSIAFGSDKWSSLCQSIELMQRYGLHMESKITKARRLGFQREREPCIASQLVLRGADCAAPSTLDAVAQAFCADTGTMGALQTCTHPRTYRGFERSAALLSNSQAILPVLDATIQRSSGMLDARAFVHLYEENNVQMSDFDDALLSVAQVREAYSELGTLLSI